MTSAWILGSPAKDGALILFPGLLWAALFPFAPEESVLIGALAFFAVVIVDGGHVYATLWRTYFRGVERDSSPIYWQTPLAIVAVMTAWFAFGLPRAWSFVVYATLFHHFRQYYGMLRWYERLNSRACRISEFFLYALTITPFVLLHFRPEPALRDIMLYAHDDLFLTPDPRLWGIGLGVMAILWSAWAGFEASQFVDGKREWNRCLAIFAPAALAAYCFLWAKDAKAMILPLMINHGVPYFTVVALSLRRLEPRRYTALAWVAGMVVASAAGFALLETALERNVLTIDNAYVTYPLGFWNSLLLGLYLIPLLSHYVLDAYIWTGRHREARIVYAKCAP